MTGKYIKKIGNFGFLTLKGKQKQIFWESVCVFVGVTSLLGAVYFSITLRYPLHIICYCHFVTENLMVFNNSFHLAHMNH
jgi:hypothetical protein